MIFGTFNVDPALLKVLKPFYGNIIVLDNKAELPTLEGLLIDWLPPQTEPPSEKFLNQINITKKYIKDKIKIVIFDRFLSLKRKEYDWFKKNGVILFEPALNYRRDSFGYLPQPLDINNLLSLTGYSVEERNVDLGYSGSIVDRLVQFEKYYLKPSMLLTDSKIRYNSNIPEEKEKEYLGINLAKENLKWKDVKFTIGVSTPMNYKIGYLDEYILEALKNGCVVLLPEEQRYYISLSPYTIIRNFNDINYYLKSGSDSLVREAIVLDMLTNFQNRYPEFDVGYFIDTIKTVMR